MTTRRGCGIIFYNRRKKAVLLFRRDNKSSIPFPNMLDILGGGVDEGERPEDAAAREMAEELVIASTGRPYVLQEHKHFLTYTDKRGCEQHIFSCPIDFEIDELHLLEGKELVYLTQNELDEGLKLAFEFERVVEMFFDSNP